MNQVYDGSFSDALHATLLLKDPLRDWCERNIIGQTAISFFIWEKVCKEGQILHWTSPRLPEQGGFWIHAAKTEPNEHLKFDCQVSEELGMEPSDCMVGGAGEIQAESPSLGD